MADLIQELIRVRNELDRLIERHTTLPATDWLKPIGELDLNDIYQKFIPEWSQQTLINSGAEDLKAMIKSFKKANPEFNPRGSPKTIDEIYDFLDELMEEIALNYTVYGELSNGRQKFLSVIRKNYTLWAERYNKRLRYLRDKAMTE